jgi:hypothetical protein
MIFVLCVLKIASQLINESLMMFRQLVQLIFQPADCYSVCLALALISRNPKMM